MKPHPLRDIGIDHFLSEYWQKKPLLIRQAFPEYTSPLDGDELAGLACEPDVESRIVHTLKNNKPWQLEMGPFREERFADLPQRDWTLLVQGVDTWCEELADLLDNFRFIPNWQLDDIMASYSPPGGSVGPHFDEYDVFLLQADGEREWRIGQVCDHTEPCVKGTPLRILQQFDECESWTLSPGDMLYLPPRFAHYGVANTPGITLSIGFRSPAYEEVVDGICQKIINDLPDGLHVKHQSSDASRDPGIITTEVIQKVKSIITDNLTNDRIASWFGEYSTSKKNSEILHEPMTHSAEDILEALETSDFFVRAEETRVSYYTSEEALIMLFVSGETMTIKAGLMPLVELLCKNRKIKVSTLLAVINNTDITTTPELSLLKELVNKGYYYFE